MSLGQWRYHILQKLGLKPVSTQYLNRPDGLAGPGEFNIYIVEQHMLDDLTGAASSGG